MNKNGMLWGLSILSLFFFLSDIENATAAPTDPIILYTDIVSGPNSGGENDNGAYLSIYGLNLGSSAGLGTATKVYIDDVEVADYKYMGNAVSQPLSPSATIQRISVQIGSIGSPLAGTPLPIKVVVDGVSSNIDKTFTVQPGDMIYVSLSGSDSTGDGSFDNPYRFVQNASKTNPAWSNWGAGDTIIMRGGSWQDVGADNYFLRIDMSKDGTAPDGAAGSGYMAIMGYPGESVVIYEQYTPGLSNSGIHGPGSGFYETANYVSVSNLVIHDDTVKEFGDGAGDGQIYAAASGEGWRVVNNEVTARVGTVVDQRGSGIGGAYKNAVIMGNYIHDIQGVITGDPTFLNHGMYFDNNDSDTVEIAYNHIENIDGGNSIQWYGASYTGVIVHHNLLDGAGKHGFNDDGLVNSKLYNNVVKNIYNAGYRRNADNAVGVYISHNTFYDCNTSNNGSYATLYETARQQTSGPIYENNIIQVVTGQNYWSNNTIYKNATLNNNLYFGSGAPPISDVNAVYGDPLFMDAGINDFRIQSASPAVDSGATLSAPILNDYLMVSRPQGSALDIGAYEFDGVVKDEFGGDGKSDILLRNSSSGQLYLYEMDGNSVTPSNIGALNTIWTVQGIGDFGGDGKSDILLRNSNTGQLFLYEMDSNSVTPSNIGALNPVWTVQGIGDFGGDGKADILLRNSSSGQLYLYEMDGNSVIPSNIGALNPVWTVQGIGDFGGDGKADILLRNSSSGQLYLYEMDGNSVTPSNIGTLNAVWTVQGIGDFGGDGKADILLRNSSTGQLYLYEMDGNSVTPSNIGALNTAWVVERVADYGGDGKADILLRNSSTGQLFLYEMDGNSVTPSNIGALSTSWAVEVQ